MFTKWMVFELSYLHQLCTHIGSKEKGFSFRGWEAEVPSGGAWTVIGRTHSLLSLPSIRSGCSYLKSDDPYELLYEDHNIIQCCYWKSWTTHYAWINKIKSYSFKKLLSTCFSHLSLSSKTFLNHAVKFLIRELSWKLSHFIDKQKDIAVIQCSHTWSNLHFLEW